MKGIAIGVGMGMIAGAAVVATAIGHTYPDVGRRMYRDGKRAVKHAKRMIG